MAEEHAVSDEFRQQHPGLDEWFYEIAIPPSRYSKPLAYIATGGRTIHLVDVEGIRAYRKWDRQRADKGSFDGAREKVAADLAQLTGVAVPAAVLWKHSKEYGSLQKEPPHFFIQTLSMVARSCEVDPVEGETILQELVDSYDPVNAFFDVWLCNRDRHSNLENTLVAESTTGRVTWLIDYNSSLGHFERPWTDAHDDHHGFEDTEPPVPSVFFGREDWVKKVHLEAENAEKRLLAVEDDAVSRICERAFSYYRLPYAIDLGAELANRLNRRKTRVKEWTCHLLGI